VFDIETPLSIKNLSLGYFIRDSSSSDKFLTGEYTAYSNYAIVLATLLYHPLDITNYYKSIPFWANISVIGGLLLLLKD